MTSDIVGLATTSATAAWLTKVSIDLIRQRWATLDGNWVLGMAGVLALLFNFGWAVYQGESLAGSSDYARIVLQSVLSVLGAVASTEAQTAAKKAVAKKEREKSVS